MHNDDAHFSALMDRLGERLKLASHQVRGRRIVGPADIEGHKGPDGKYYLVDLARMFPVRTRSRVGLFECLWRVCVRVVCLLFVRRV